MITVKELAEKCGVSIATISNIFNNKSNVSIETKEKVLKVAEEYGYKPNILARTLRLQKTKTIGLLIEEITAFSTPYLVEGIMEVFENLGYRVIFENLRVYSRFENYEDYLPEFRKAVDSAINLLLSYKVDGIIYVAAHSRSIDFLYQLQEVPLVLCYSECNDLNICEILIDDFDASCKMINSFFEKNYTQIGIIKTSEKNLHGKNRMEGCIHSFEKNNAKLIKDFVVEGNWSRESGYKACEMLFNNGFFKQPQKKAIFCFNDLMAAGVYDFLSHKKINIPKDVAVAGFDNREVSQFLKPELTTMEIPLLEIGQKSAKVLYNLILEKKEESKKILIPCKLIVRTSI